jgi:hypothetical protein
MAITKAIIATDTPTASVIRTWLGNTQDEKVASGFLVTDVSALNVGISAGTALIKDASGEMYQVVSTAADSLTLTDDTTNYVYLHCDNGSDWLTDSESSTVPADAILLATVVTASGDITSVTDGRATGKYKREYCRLGMVSTDNVTYNFTIHLNPSQDRYIKITKVIYAICTNPYAWVNVYYDIGDGEVTLDETGGNDGYVAQTMTFTPNTSTDDKTFDSYIRFELESTSSGYRHYLTSMCVCVEEWS